MYCGNNALNPDLINGTKIIGNRVDCFRRGVGVGLSMPYEPKLNTEYRPIDERKLYCGRAEYLPIEYDIMGSNYMCLRKGIGVGRNIKAKKRVRAEEMLVNQGRGLLMSFTKRNAKRNKGDAKRNKGDAKGNKGDAKRNKGDAKRNKGDAKGCQRLPKARMLNGKV